MTAVRYPDAERLDMEAAAQKVSPFALFEFILDSDESRTWSSVEKVSAFIGVYYGEKLPGQVRFFLDCHGKIR